MTTKRAKFFFTGAGAPACDFILDDAGRERSATRRGEEIAGARLPAAVTLTTWQELFTLLETLGSGCGNADKADEVTREAEVLERQRKWREAEAAREAARKAKNPVPEAP